MTVAACAEYAFANHVSQINIMLLAVRHSGRNVDPNGTMRNAMIEVFAMKIDCIAFKFNSEKSNKANRLPVELLRLRNQLNQAHVLH